MTFDLNAAEALDYDTAKDFVDMVKPGWHIIQPEHVLGVRPDLTISQINSFFKTLNRAGLIDLAEASRQGFGHFEFTESGRSLVHSKLMPRLTPKQAEACYSKVLETVSDWNADPANPVTLTSVRLFGSYLEDRPNYGDVDIAVSTDLRPEARSSIADLYAQLPKKRKERIYNTPGEVVMGSVVEGYWLDKAITRIERICPGAAVVTSALIDDLGCEFREVLRFSASNGEQLQPENVTHGRTRERDLPEPPELYEGEVFIVPKEHPGDKGTPEHMVFDSHSIEFLMQCLYAWPLKDKGGRTPYCMGHLIEGENFPAWQLDADTTFDKLREVTKKAEELGLVSFSDIEITVSSKYVHLAFEVSDEQSVGSNPRVIFKLLKRGESYSIDIRPEYRGGDSGSHRVKETLGGPYMAMARSLFGPMREILGIAKYPSGVEGHFSFIWNACEDDPVFPKLQKLAASLKSIKPAIEASDLSHLYEEVHMSNQERRNLRVCSDCRLQIDEDGSSLSRETHAYNTMRHQAQGMFSGHGLLKDHEALIDNIIENYELPYLEMSVHKAERLNLNDPHKGGIDDFMECVDVIPSNEVDNPESGLDVGLSP